MWAAVHLGALPSAHVELHEDHYAEPHRDMLMFGHEFRVMPFNTLVCAGYVLVGLAWLLLPAQLDRPKRRLRPKGSAYAALFAAGSVVYGFAQAFRLVLRTREWAVVDQWITLPFFALVPPWLYSWRAAPAAALLAASIASYGLAELHRSGFEVALGLHIIAAAAAGVARARQYSGARRECALAIACCAGFVILKLSDHWLAAAAPAVFGETLTGHFWSKVCDVLQIHYTLEFCSRVGDLRRRGETRPAGAARVTPVEERLPQREYRRAKRQAEGRRR
eukprot:TRINITY_DN22150_c0_g1_i1.p1 TRINITY_DN22150_c0_g1~~TRINITY_DN22150_c0_g1_i1.p1  ORF type:complete len:318 (+),score=107.47 TRINITY_DN22150_c0_g1_i1:123-956(+)